MLADATLPAAAGMSELWGSRTFGNILVVGGIAGILTSWNGFLLGASRLLYAMASSGMVPSWFAKVHPRYRTPSNAVLFIGGLSVLSPLFGRQMLVWLVDAGGISIVVAFLLVAVTFLVLRRIEPDMERPFRVSQGRAVGVAAALLTLGLGVLVHAGHAGRADLALRVADPRRVVAGRRRARAPAPEDPGRGACRGGARGRDVRAAAPLT